MRHTVRGRMLLICAVLLLAAGCNLPQLESPTPFVFPTPNLTMTAIFKPTLVAPSATSSAPEAQPTTPIPTQEPSATSTAVPPTATNTLLPPSPTATFAPPTAAPTSTPVATRSNVGPEMRSKYSVTASYFSDPPKMDGAFGEWGLTHYAVNAVVYGEDKWNNAADLSALVMIGWDETNLYLAVRVHDDRYVQGAAGEDIFKGDSVEILLDTKVSADYYQSSLSSDDYQLGFSPGSPALGEETEAYLWYPRSEEGTRSKVVIGVRSLEDGYRLEAAIPWSIFDVDASKGQHFGFALSVSDNDKVSADVQQSMVSNVPTRELTDPTTWGDLTLVKP